MTDCEALQTTVKSSAATERRAEPRQPVSGTLWMIDHEGETILPCHCIETSSGGMRLRVPLGYGVAEGQRYELRSHLPGRRPVDGFGLVGSRWATIVRTDPRVVENEDHLDVGVVLDMADTPALMISATTALV